MLKNEIITDSFLWIVSVVVSGVLWLVVRQVVQLRCHGDSLDGEKPLTLIVFGGGWGMLSHVTQNFVKSGVRLENRKKRTDYCQNEVTFYKPHFKLRFYMNHKSVVCMVIF